MTRIDFRKYLDPNTCLILGASIYFMLLLVEIFYFSSSFSLSWLRQIDDPIYHEDLRRIHLDIIHGHYGDLFKSNNNGYGWIFWTLHGIATFPFYFLYAGGVKVPLIVSGRVLSWCFTVGATIFIYKIIAEYTHKPLIKVLAVITFLSFPHIAFWAMGFRSDSMAFFLVTWAFYLSIAYRAYTFRTLAYTALILAAAIGTKFTSIFILPFILANVIEALLRNHTYKEIFLRLVYVAVVLVLGGVFFTSPGLLLYFYTQKYYHYYIAVMNTYAALHVDTGETAAARFRGSFDGGNQPFLGYYSAILFMSATLITAVYRFLKKKKCREELLTLATILGTYIILVLMVKHGDSYINVYAQTICFLYCFAYLNAGWNERSNTIIAILLCTFNLFENGPVIFESFTSYYHYSKTPHVSELKEANNELLPLVDEGRKLHGSNIAVLVDYRAIFPYTSLDAGVKSIALLDDISVRKSWISTGYDYVVLLKSSDLVSGNGELSPAMRAAEPKVRNTFLQSYHDTQQLLKAGLLNNSKYTKIYDKHDLVVFYRDDPKNTLCK